MMTQQERLMTINDVAMWLHCHPMTVRNLVNRKELRCVRVGSAWRFKREDVLAYMDSRTI